MYATYPPAYARLTDHSGIVRYALAFPSAAYIIWTTVTAMLLTIASMLFVRRAAKIGEQTFWGKLAERFTRYEGSGERTRPPRHVWSNPVAWREAKTRAGGSGGSIRWTLIIGGAVGSLLLFVQHTRGTYTASDVRGYLSGLVMVQFAIALIIATNTAATSMTREKESKMPT